MRLFTRFIRDAPYTSHIPSVRIYVDFSFGPSADSPVFYSFSTQIMGPLITDERCRGIRFELLLKVITAVFGKEKYLFKIYLKRSWTLDGMQAGLCQMISLRRIHSRKIISSANLFGILHNDLRRIRRRAVSTC